MTPRERAQKLQRDLAWVAPESTDVWLVKVTDAITAAVAEANAVPVASRGGLPTAQEIERIQALFEQATPGPWDVHLEPVETRDDARRELAKLVGGTPMFSGHVPMLTSPSGLSPAVTGCGTDGLPNAQLIVALRNAAPGLLAAARQALAGLVATGTPYEREECIAWVEANLGESVADQLRAARERVDDERHAAGVETRAIPDFGDPDVDPEDSERLSRLRELIDSKLGWRDAKQMEGGDYEARLTEVADALAVLRRMWTGDVDMGEVMNAHDALKTAVFP